jgi:hypothetical protein
MYEPADLQKCVAAFLLHLSRHGRSTVAVSILASIAADYGGSMGQVQTAFPYVYARKGDRVRAGRYWSTRLRDCHGESWGLCASRPWLVGAAGRRGGVPLLCE